MSKRSQRRQEIDSAAELQTALRQGWNLKGWVIQGIDLTDQAIATIPLQDTLFVGCVLTPEQRIAIAQAGGHVMPPLGTDLPYDPYRHTLYSAKELLSGYDKQGYTGTADFEIYEHFDRERNHSAGASIREALAQRIHDHAIDDALAEAVDQFRGKGVVGIMGGHGTPRNDPYYKKVVELAWRLTREGYLVATGGGPGIMEAGNLGAFLAPYSDVAVVDVAIEWLSEAPRYDGGFSEGTPEYLNAIQTYVEVAVEVEDRLFGPESGENAEKFGRVSATHGTSLAIPTWFYGHEPTNVFGNLVAKYFANSIREDGLLAISDAGVVFAPGSAGTLQEIFMDLAQNHYATFKARSAMVLLGTERFSELHNFIQHFIARRAMESVYGDMVGLFDEADDVVEFLRAHPPRKVAPRAPLYTAENERG